MRSLWSRAACAGVAGGIAMLAVLCLAAANTGNDWESPLRWIAAALLSEPALIMAGQAQGGMSAPACITLGLTIHLIAATAFATLFLKLTNGITGWRVASFAIAYSLAIWAIMTFGLLPMFDSVMSVRVQLISTQFLLAHLVYGAILATTVLLS